MILTFTAMLTLWCLTVTLLVVWYGALIAAVIVAVFIAIVLAGIIGIAQWVVAGRGLLSDRRRRASHF